MQLAVSMAAKATALARELKSIKSGLSFTQERCALLEEENRRLRDGFAKGIRPEEDDLVRNYGFVWLCLKVFQSELLLAWLSFCAFLKFFILVM